MLARASRARADPQGLERGLVSGASEGSPHTLAAALGDTLDSGFQLDKESHRLF